jgi:integrase
MQKVIGPKTAMPRLTKRVVDAIAAEPRSANRVIWDDDLNGFGLRVRASGSISYVAVYRTGGRKRWFTIGSPGGAWTPDQARQKAAEILLDAKKGEDPQTARTEMRKRSATLDMLIQAYLRDGPADKPNQKLRTWDQDRSSLLRHVSPLIGTRSLDTLTRADIATLQSDIAFGKSKADIRTKARGRARVVGGKATAARTIIILQAMLEWGVKRGYLDTNPGKGVTRFKIEKRERYLSSAELDLLWRTLKVQCDLGQIAQSHAMIFRLLALTGARKNEIVQLQWGEIDLERHLIFLPGERSKTGAKTIPLGTAATHLLREWYEAAQRHGSVRPIDFVFPPLRAGASSTIGVQRSWERLRSAADLPDVRIHDLRHTFASIAVADGASLFIVGKVLGHTQARTTERYAHLHASPAQQVADRVAAQLGEWSGGGDA